MDLTGALVWDSMDQAFMSDEHRRVAEVISEYNHELKIVFVPPEKREFNESQPFALVHSPLGKPPYVVRRLSYAELNPGLVAWVYNNDQATTNVAERIENFYKADLALKEKELREQKAADRDMALTILKSPKNTYKHNGIVYR